MDSFIVPNTTTSFGDSINLTPETATTGTVKSQSFGSGKYCYFGSQTRILMVFSDDQTTAIAMNLVGNQWQGVGSQAGQMGFGYVASSTSGFQPVKTFGPTITISSRAETGISYSGTESHPTEGTMPLSFNLGNAGSQNTVFNFGTQKRSGHFATYKFPDTNAQLMVMGFKSGTATLVYGGTVSKSGSRTQLAGDWYNWFGGVSGSFNVLSP